MLTWKAHAGAVWDLTFTLDGRLLTSADDSTCLWDVSTQTELQRWEVGYALNIAVSPDGRMVAGSGSARLWLWSVDGGARRELTGDAYGSHFVTFSPDGQCVVGSGGVEYLFHRWEVSGGYELPGGWGVRLGESQVFGPIVFSPDGQLLATWCLDGSEAAIVLRNGDTGEEPRRLWPSAATSPVTRMLFSPDSKLLASVHGPMLILWDVPSRTEFGRGRVADKPFMGLTFTADGTRLLTASNDSYLRVWTAPTWDQTTIYKWDAGKLGCVAVSADGTVAAAGGSTGKVVVWDLD